MKLLVIDDDTRFTRSLYFLFYKSYTVHVAPLAKLALSKLQENSYDLILLDLNLPDLSGQALYKTIRDQTKRTPVIVVSGESSPVTKVPLLQSGISDYLTKPIYAEELRARVAMHIRRPTQSGGSQQFSTHDLMVDYSSRMALRNGGPIFLRSKEFALLECLAMNVGQVVSRALLLDYAWPDGRADTNNLQVHMSLLRRKIDGPRRKKLIQTVHGVGYRLEKLPVVTITGNKS